MKRFAYALAAVAALMLSLGPAMAEGRRWSGASIGVHGGLDMATIGVELSSALDIDGLSAKGFGYGVHAGFDHQFAGGKLVAGVFVDYTQTDAEFDVSVIGVGPNVLNAQLTESWSVGARLGIAMGNALPYILAGYTQAKAEASFMGTSIGSETLEGWLVGSGVEFRLADNVSVGGEVRYTKFDALSLDGGNIKLDPERYEARAFARFRFDMFGK